MTGIVTHYLTMTCLNLAAVPVHACRKWSRRMHWWTRLRFHNLNTSVELEEAINCIPLPKQAEAWRDHTNYMMAKHGAEVNLQL